MSIDMNSYRFKKKITLTKADKIGIETYFDIDKEKREATVNLHYEKPDDIFDTHFLAKIPIISDDFINELFYALRVLPSKYFVNFNIYFDDMNGYSERELENILIRSMMMTNAEWHSDEKKSNKMALFFALFGSIFLVGLWVGTAILEANFSDVSNALPYRVFYYILDILITVILWEALTIYFVKKNEDRAKHISINRRLNVVTFKKIDEKEE